MSEHEPVAAGGRLAVNTVDDLAIRAANAE